MAATLYKMTLSTTDHNLVGDIKVRQADDETQVFEVNIIENGVIKSFNGLTPFFCLMAREITGQGVSEEPVAIFDANKGTLQYTLSANAMQMVGRNEAYFSFRKESSSGRWVEQFSTKTFSYTVEKSIYTQPFKDSNYWFTFKELYQKFLEYQESGKNSWEDFVNNSKDILESLDPNGELLVKLTDKVNSVDGIVKNATDREVALSDELVTASNVVSSEGWLGSFEGGFIHQAGNETPIKITVPDLSINDSYVISFVATDLGLEDPQSDYYIQLGGTAQYKTYIGRSESNEFLHGIVPINDTDPLVITPRAGWTGMIKEISVKKITKFSKASLNVYSSENALVNEFRVDDKAQNMFWGLGSGRKNVGGYQNTAYGHDSQTNMMSGFWNTSVGYRALNKATNASRNVALGFIALENLISGDRNIAVGPYSQQRNETGSGNITLGADSGWYIKDGNNNIALGTVALGSNTSPENVIALGESVMAHSQGGTHIFAAGKYALAYNRGDYNIAIGHLAQNTNTTGNNNTSFGTQSMYRNIDGSGNVALGRRALYGSEHGSNNVALGDNALGEGTGGSDNVAIGRESLLKSLSSNNVAIGMQAQRMATTGTENVAVGNQALRNNIEGIRNVATGTASLMNTTGSKNAAYGFYAGNELTTGEENTLLGYFSGGGLKTGSRNIVIGSNTTIGAGTNDYINIGNTIYGYRDTKITQLVRLLLPDLPKTKPSTVGEVWRDGDVLKIA